MSLTTVSEKRARIYPRRFDHDECRALYQTGEWTQLALAERYGVSVSRIQQILRPELAARVRRVSRERFEALCDDCGGRCTHNWSSKHARHDRVVCRSCAEERQREENLLSRLNADGDIRCAKCGGYHPVDMYRIKRGYPEGRCRDCETAARRHYRHRHLEADRVWQREYKRRRAEELAG